MVSVELRPSSPTTCSVKFRTTVMPVSSSPYPCQLRRNGCCRCSMVDFFVISISRSCTLGSLQRRIDLTAHDNLHKLSVFAKLSDGKIDECIMLDSSAHEILPSRLASRFGGLLCSRSNISSLSTLLRALYSLGAYKTKTFPTLRNASTIIVRFSSTVNGHAFRGSLARQHTERHPDEATQPYHPRRLKHQHTHIHH